MAGTPAQKGYNEAGNTDSSRKTVALAGWPTPTAQENAGDLEKKAARRAKNKAKWKGITGNGFGYSLAEAAMTFAAWATPAARDWKSSASNLHGQNARPLNEQARLASWATPCRQDGPNGGPNQGTDRLPGAAQLAASGQTPNGSHAAMAKPGQLNPEHSRWLMGLPAAWPFCAPERRPKKRTGTAASAPCMATETPSSPPSQPPSSPQP